MRRGIVGCRLRGCPRALLSCGFVSRIIIQLTDNRPEEWLLIEWPEGEKEPTEILAFDPSRTAPASRHSVGVSSYHDDPGDACVLSL